MTHEPVIYYWIEGCDYERHYASIVQPPYIHADMLLQTHKGGMRRMDGIGLSGEKNSVVYVRSSATNPIYSNSKTQALNPFKFKFKHSPDSTPTDEQRC